MGTSVGEEISSSTNRPRNHLVTDATQPFEFVYQQFGKPATVVVRQTPNEETWPGGALWDIGVLLSHALVGLTSGTVSSSSKGIRLPSRIFEAIDSVNNSNKADWTVLELGTGVGLTGLVAAACWGTQLTILTDLDVVIDQVTQPNLIGNSTPCPKKPYRLMNTGKRGRVMAMPLCWGVEADEKAVAETFEQNTKTVQKSRSTKKGKKKKAGDAHQNQNDETDDTSKPNLIIIGDVAYQHKPGAPSHFDALVSTLQKFLGSKTIVIFGSKSGFFKTNILLIF